MTNKKLITVVTDHRLMADTIATAIGATGKHEGYYYGNGYAVTWTNGRVIEATFKPCQSFVLSTKMDCRLVFANNFDLAVRNYDELVGYKKSEQDAKQLSVIEALWKMSHTVINATIPDIEGDLSFLSLYYYIKCPVTVRRAWLPILTKREIVKAVVEGQCDTERYEKWLSDSIYNKIVKLSKANVPCEGSPIVAEMQLDTAQTIADEHGFDAPANAYVEQVDNNVMVFTDHYTLYNLMGLTVDAVTELDFTHEETFKTALSLYTKKLISYPFTTQNTIPWSVWRLMLKNHQVLGYNSKWGHLVSKKYQKKINHHHNFRYGENAYNGFGIITTGLHPTDLTPAEEKLYNMIVKRVIDAFTFRLRVPFKKPKKVKTA